MSREQGDTKIDLWSTKNYFGEHQENNSGSREKKVKFQREQGDRDPPLRGLIITQLYYDMWSIIKNEEQVINFILL